MINVDQFSAIECKLTKHQSLLQLNIFNILNISYSDTFGFSDIILKSF